ncbi:alkylmercury lyase family protein [Actinocatenispora sera]|uniref:Membrane protein n=1 Tax=Actinocatenispora sera TaxID=390989 RepID=A0A810KZB2_9ACTN|nr:alkylmercury lyase family protein [Actinocatenispora sera]BCJ28523.1 membrane protein [Actinocatenispora sera]
MATADIWQLRQLVYATFANEGRAPSVAELARRAGLPPEAVLTNLRELAELHALVLAPDGDAVRMAHPFSTAPMAFVVTPVDGRDDRRWWGGCAWDSFGIGAALELEVRIDTACPECGGALSIEAGPETAPSTGAMAVWFPKPAARWWDDVVATCTRIRLFCNPQHAGSWSTRRGETDGQIVGATTVWSLAQPWYGDRLDGDYAPHSRGHNQALLESRGLTGEFWRLP